TTDDPGYPGCCDSLTTDEPGYPGCCDSLTTDEPGYPGCDLGVDDGHRLNLDQELGPEEALDLDQGAGGRVLGVHMAVPDRPHGDQIADVGQVVVQLDHVLKRGPGRPERVAEIGEHLLGLRFHVPRADQLPLLVQGYLAGDIDQAAGPARHVAV